MDISTQVIDSNNLPKRLLRNGMIIIFVNSIIFISILMGLKTNETIDGQIVIETADKNLQIFARKEGVFHALKKEGELVQKNELVGVYENYTSYDNVLTLKNWLTTLELNEVSLGSNKVFLKSQMLKKFDIGEIRPLYSSFVNECFQYYYLNYVEKNYLKKVNDFDYAQLNNIYGQVQNISTSDSILFEQNRLSYKKRDRDSFLLKENIISEADFELTLKTKLDAELIKLKNRISVGNTENEGLKLNKSMAEVSQSLQDRKNQVLKQIKVNFDLLLSELEKWEYFNVVKSSINGKCTFKTTGNSFFVTASQNFLTIYPIDTLQFVGYLQVHAERIGKVKIGSNVTVKLKEYPYYEYGALSGRVQYIAKIPFDNTYNITVELPNGLLTNYNKKIEGVNTLTGIGQIIVNKSNIFNHIVNFFRWQRANF